MTHCPYPESTRAYQVWHEGYEAHKFEIIGKVRFLQIKNELLQKYENELISEVIKQKLLTSRLEKQINSAEKSETI